MRSSAELESARIIKLKMESNVVCFAARWYLKTFSRIPIGKLFKKEPGSSSPICRMFLENRTMDGSLS